MRRYIQDHSLAVKRILSLAVDITDLLACIAPDKLCLGNMLGKLGMIA